MEHQHEEYSEEFLEDLFSDIPCDVKTANLYDSGSDNDSAMYNLLHKGKCFSNYHSKNIFSFH